ncbi:MAG: DEAD/DEAH box helicase [Pseudomonadota bacterium]
MTEFAGLAPSLAHALAARGYTETTPVQAAVLEPGLEEADLLVSAQTGSGKTVAFGLALAPTLLGDQDRFERAGAPLALAVAPTRELALQVKRELDWLYADTGAVLATCVGGMDPRAERRALERGAHIVVGTPGRLRDHVTRGALDTSAIRGVVLDEADEMLDLGFREDLEFILDATPTDRRTLLFSATVPAQIARLATRYQRDAVRVSTQGERKQHADIDYRVLVAAPHERDNAIINVLRYHDAANALVFCNTRAAVNHMVARFHNRGFSVVALSGELSQNERLHALQALRDGRAQVCIATDVAARGIDLPALELVIHADLPTNPETLLHRSGRTGRAGRKGTSALVIEQKGRARAERLLRAAGLDASWSAPPGADDVIRRDEERLLSHPALLEEAHPEEEAFAQHMLERFSPEQIAVACLRFGREGKSAPEDIRILQVEPPRTRQRKERPHETDRSDPRPANREPKAERREFEDSVWVTLSIGRKQNAEPRWLIPMICNGGGITKSAIGAIKIQPTETHVQIDAGEAETFLSNLAPKFRLDKSVRVSVREGPPQVAAPKKPAPAKKKRKPTRD